MTTVQYIHGIPANEMAQRGLEVQGQPYIPYTSLSRGEMRVALAAERATIYAQAYPDLPEYRTAAAMLNNALYAGVHRGVSFVGAMHDPLLQNVARIIAKAKSQSRPASTAFIGRTSLAQGIAPGIGAFSEIDCTIYARDKCNAFYGKNESSGWYQSPLRKPMYRDRFKSYEQECAIINAVQGVVNERIESSAHHLLYKSILKGFKGLAGTRMDNKLYDHIASITGLANIAFVSDSKLIDDWTENGILRYNSAGGIGPVDSQKSGWGVATSANPEVQAAYDAYRSTHVAGIGFEPITTAAVVALVGAVTKALASAAAFQRSLNEKRNAAAQVAKGYGTPALSAEEGDWPDGGDNGGSGSGGNSDLLLYGGLAAAAYLLLKD